VASERRWIRAARAVVAGLIFFVAAQRRAQAQTPPREPLVFVADPKMGVETSVRSIDSLGRLASRYEDVFPTVHIEERGFPGKLLRFVGRAAQLAFIDEPLAEVTTTLAHEAGGHGARARELGFRPTFLFYLPGVYRLIFAPGDEASASAFTRYRTAGMVEGEKEVIGTLGGVEANYVHAWWINARVVRGEGWTNKSDLLLYTVAKLMYADSFLTVRGRGDVERSNDVASYIGSLQDFSNGWRSRDRDQIARRLRIGYIWNLADPMLLNAVYGSIVSVLARGEPGRKAPLPRWRGNTLLVSPRFALTPFGAEHALDLFAGDANGRLVDVYARVGSSGLASYYGAGARILGLPLTNRFALGMELDVWRQPELLLDEHAVFDRPSRVGVNAGVYGDVRLGDVLSITGKLAGKTSGYLMGQPVGAGPHGYLGVSLAWR